MKNKANIAINLFTAMVLLAALAQTSFAKDEDTAKSSIPSPPNVVVTIKPIHSMVSAVMGDLATPTLLLDKSKSAHDYTLKPSDMKKIQAANVIFFVSMDLEHFLVNTIPSLKKGTVTVELAASKGVSRRPVSSAEPDGHEHSAYDPHVWLSPENAIAMIKQISKVLSALDSKNRGIYEVNANNYIKKISEASEKITLSLSPYKNVPFVTFHDAYGYFVKQYGLNQASAVSINPEIQLSAERISGLNYVIKNRHVYCVFADPEFPQDSVKKLLNNPDRVKIGMLDAIGIEEKPGESAYIAIMQNISKNLLSCFQDE